jgi:hypothetical protein
LYEANKWTILSNGDGKSIRKNKQCVASDEDEDDDDIKKKPPPASAVETKLKGQCFIKGI